MDALKGFRVNGSLKNFNKNYGQIQETGIIEELDTGSRSVTTSNNIANIT